MKRNFRLVNFGAALFLFCSCESYNDQEVIQVPFDLLTNATLQFEIEMDNHEYGVHLSKIESGDKIIVLTNLKGSTLDTFLIGDSRASNLVKQKGSFIDLYKSIRSTGSHAIDVTRLAIIDNQLIPIYLFSSHQMAAWDNFSKDSLLEVVSHVENQYYEYIIHDLGHRFPDELRMVRTSVETERDTMGHVMQADTSFTQTRLIRDQRTGVYMERYLNHEEIQQANRVFDTDSIPMLRGAFYYKGQWDY